MIYQVNAANLKKIRFNEEDPVSSVLQNIAIILSTPKGSVPLYRDFGLSTTILDRPTPLAEKALIAEVREAIEKWEPRARFVSISFEKTLEGVLLPTVEVEIIGES